MAELTGSASVQVVSDANFQTGFNRHGSLVQEVSCGKTKTLDQLSSQFTTQRVPTGHKFSAGFTMVGLPDRCATSS